MQKAIIFDFDGLILDTETIEAHIWMELYAQASVKFDLETYRESIGSYNIHPYKPGMILSENGFMGKTGEEISLDILEKTSESMSNSPLLPGVLEVIKTAKTRNIKLAIGSSSPRAWVKSHLTERGLWDIFDTVVTNDDVSLCKPSPEIFNLVLERLNVKPENAVVLEDSVNGMLAANQAGIRVIIIPNEITKVQNFDRAFKVLNSLLELNLDDIF